MPRLPLFRLLLCVCLSGILQGGAEPAAEIEVWRKESTYLAKEALIELENLPAPETAAARRERDFCAAVVQLDQQPLSEQRLDDVEGRLQSLLAAGGGDEIADAARFILGRIAQLYRAQPDMARAAEYYQALVDQPGPGHWAELARVKLAVLKLYVLPAETKQARIDAVLRLLHGATDPRAVRDLHHLVARAGMFFGFPPELALEHLLAADRIGGLTGTTGADQLVQIGELAWDAGQPELSAHFYERLRNEYPREARIFLHDQRVAGNPVPQRREELSGR